MRIPVPLSTPSHAEPRPPGRPSAQDSDSEEATHPRCTTTGTDTEGRSYDRGYVPAPILLSLVAEPRRRFGDRLRALRRQAGLSQQALGEAAGLDRKTISRVEGGVYSPTLDLVFLIAAALGRPPIDLFVWSEPVHATAGSDETTDPPA